MEQKGNGEGRDKVKILSHWMQQLFLKCSFFLNCLAVTRSTKLYHEEILMGMRELKNPSNESLVSFMIYC